MNYDPNSYYYNQMKGWLFTKSNDTKKTRKFAIGGLGYRSKNSLQQVLKMGVGDSIEINGYILTRVE